MQSHEGETGKSNESLQTIQLMMPKNSSAESKTSKVNCQPEVFLGVNSADEIRKLAKLSKRESSLLYRQHGSDHDFTMAGDGEEGRSERDEEDEKKKLPKVNQKRPRGRPKKNKTDRPSNKKQQSQKPRPLKSVLQMSRFSEGRVDKRKQKGDKPPNKTTKKQTPYPNKKNHYDVFYIGKLRNYVTDDPRSRYTGRTNNKRHRVNKNNNNANNHTINNNNNNKENNNNNNNINNSRSENEIDMEVEN